MKRKHCSTTDNSELVKQRKREKPADREESMASENEEITPTPTTPPASTDEDENNAAAMRSLEADLHDVEQQLHGGSASSSSSSSSSIGGLASPRAGGSAFFHSIRSALGSIRTRLEELQEHCGSTTALEHNPTTLDPTSTTSTVAAAAGLAQENSQALVVQHHGAGVASAASSVGERLMDRLRNAEFAHSNRIPLNMLRHQQQREASAESSVSDNSNRGRFGTKRDREEQEGGGTKTEEQGDCEGMDVTPTSSGGVEGESDNRSNRRAPRRMSVMVASRRRVAEVEGPQVDMDLHGTASTLLIGSNAVFGDTIDAVTESKEEEDDETSQEPEGEDVPTILLTKKSHSKLDLAQRAVLFPDTARSEASSEAESESDKQTTSKPSTVVYSWGLGANSLHGDSADIPLAAARVDSTSRAGRNDIVSCGIGKFHIGCVTSAGELLMAGSNLSGEVDPDRRDETSVSKPVLLESLFQATVLQVSCGAHHTAALRANGTVLTWGSNEYGELGHRCGTKPAPAAVNVRPAVMALGPGQRAISVACGDGFTLCLTSRMKLLVCGVEDVTGFASEEARRLPLSIPALEDLPLVSIAAGRRHAVAVTGHGSAYTWGDNSSGACGREYPNKFTMPIPFRCPAASATTAGKMLREPLTNWVYLEDGADQKPNASLSDDVAVVHVTCGDDHTVMVTRAGGLLVCGNNKFGQIGLDPNQNEIVFHPKRVAHPDQKRSFKQAEAGESHTLLLDDFGDVWQMGGEEEKKVGCNQVFTAKMIQFIAAGGRQSVAVASTPTRGPLRRELSDPIVTNDGDLALADSLEEVILTIPEESDNTKILKRAEELFRTPAVLNSLFLDPTELEDIYSKLLKVDTPNFRKSIASAIEKGMHKGLENLRSDDTRLMWPEQVRFLLLYVQCPLFVDWKTDDSVFDRRGDLILALCETILELNYEGYKALMAWATSIYPREQFVRYLVRPLLSQLKKGLSVAAGAERRPIPAIVSVLRWLYNASERDGNIAAPEDFYSDAVSNINPEELLNDLQRYKAASTHKRAAEFFFCDNPFLLSPSTKRNLLQIESELNMLKVASRGLTYNAEERTFEFNPFYVLDIDRDHLLTQTLQKLSKAEPKDLRKKLRVVFKGEDGVDAGGVTREFFQLLCTQLFDVLTGMWSTRFQDGKITWFNSDCSWNDEGFFLSGILVGLAVYNGVLLDVHFPQAVYRKLLGLPLGFEDLFDEEIKSGLQQLLDYEGEDVEDVFCLTFDVNWMDLGVEKRRELKPNGSNIAVTSDNKEEYVMLYVRWLLVDSIYPQYQSFEAGFLRVMEDSTLDLLRPEDLELLVVGSPELDFAALEENTEYEGGFTADSPVIRNFWRFVQNASKELQLDLLKFTTGSTKAPIGGLGKLNFKIQRAGPDSNHLPTSHTCFNTLLLPDYGENYEKLEERLSRAIIECEGFGLQ